VADTQSPLRTVDRDRLQALIEREHTTFADNNPTSLRLFQEARATLLAGVPMTWMANWPGRFPLTFDEAHGNRISDADGHTYIDFCLGDTGAMTGHSPEPVVRAVRERLETKGGITTMLPTADSTAVGAQLQQRFGLPFWSFTLSATDANRFVLRMLRQISKRPFVLVMSECYHGSVDETVIKIDLETGNAIAKPGNVGPDVDPTLTSKCVEFNDVEGLRAALAPRDVACVLLEPAMTNIGIVPPASGYLAALEEICHETETLIVYDETHTFSAGPGGCVRAWGLHPDAVTMGKALGAGIPIGAFGFSAAVAERVLSDPDADLVSEGGVGGTLAGNPLSAAAARATLEDVLTEEYFAHMIDLCTRFTEGVQATLDRERMPWCVVQLGARAEYRFCPEIPATGGASFLANDFDLDEYLHTFMANRGILMTPFHNMALMCPTTTATDVDRHTELFARAVADLVG
jgi:glutamate-1-semialdehyde 2,1-aminomutase